MFSNLFKNKQAAQNKLDQKRIPAHVAIIMDGNGRWAKKRGLPRVAGTSREWRRSKRSLKQLVI